MRQISRLFIVSLFTFILGCSLSLAVYSNYISLQCDEENDIPRRITRRLKSTLNLTKSYEYVVLILSKYDNIEQRNVIRETWLRLLKNKHIYYGSNKERWMHYFFISTANLSEHSMVNLNKEHSEHGDIVMLPHLKEVYAKLTLKLVESLKWIHSHNPNLMYILKCDDDSFVRIDLIIKELHIIRRNGMESEQMQEHKVVDVDRFRISTMPPVGLYWGYFKGNAHVQKKGKWSQKEFFMCDRYLPYAQGGGYVLSYDIVDYIVRNYNYFKLYKSEDVSVGVWTAALSNINRLHDKRFDTEWTSRGCDNDMLIRHKQSPDDMREMYVTLVNSGNLRLCSKLSFLRSPYDYNWNVAPSQCCSQG